MFKEKNLSQLEIMLKIRKNKMIASKLKKQIQSIEDENLFLKRRLENAKQQEVVFLLMRRQPIKKPSFIGCFSCSPILTVKQNKTDVHFVGYDYGLCEILLYEKGTEQPVEIHSLIDYFEDEECTFEEIEEVFDKELKAYDYIEVVFTSGLRGEVYEYNKEDQEWYLTEQNKGWA